jgi:putative ABC transport system substrate-binding protein
MKRRKFLGILGGAVAWPLAARAQQTDRVRRIGVLMGYAENDSEARAQFAAFRDGFQKLGWTEGRNIRIDTRWTIPAEAELMQRYAKELAAATSTTASAPKNLILQGKGSGGAAISQGCKMNGRC